MQPGCHVTPMDRNADIWIQEAFLVSGRLAQS
jgi:hypothetical protein